MGARIQSLAPLAPDCYVEHRAQAYTTASAVDDVVPRKRRTPAGVRLVETAVEGRMKPLIMAIVQSLVDKPDQIEIKEVIGEHAHVLELRVAKEDLGKVIGKGGAHASAIRTIMAATSGKEKKRYILEIIEH
jgi:predicted RNA-binding protein YlqC (UPF0109 family)